MAQLWRTSFSGQDSAVHLHLKRHSFEDDDLHVLDREDGWFERGMKEAKLEQPSLHRWGGLEITCWQHTIQFWNPSQGKLTKVHALVHVKPVTHMMTGRVINPTDDGWIWITMRGNLPFAHELGWILGTPYQNLELKNPVWTEVKHFQRTTRSPVTFSWNNKTTSVKTVCQPIYNRKLSSKSQAIYQYPKTPPIPLAQGHLR